MVDPADSRKSPPPKGKATPCSSRWRQTIATLSASCSSGPRTTGGGRPACAPAGLAVGQKSDEEWTLLDSNSASDSDLWIARSLLEAGRLWQMPQYTEVGKALLSRIADEEVTDVPGFGPMVLPGKVGFADDKGWRFNPSYLPPQLASYFSRFGAPAETARQQPAFSAGDGAQRFSLTGCVTKRTRLAAEGGQTDNRQLRRDPRLSVGRDAG